MEHIHKKKAENARTKMLTWVKHILFGPRFKFNPNIFFLSVSEDL